MIRKFLALTLLIVPLALVACGDDDETSSVNATSEQSSTETGGGYGAASGGGDDGAAATTEDAAGGGETIAIAETEYKLDPAEVTAKAGSVTLDVSNDGGAVHNLEIEGNDVEEVTDMLDPGDSGSLTVDLAPGEYELYCAIDGHRDLGMEGSLTVE